LKRQEAFEASRRRLQEKLDADSAKFAEEQKKVVRLCGTLSHGAPGLLSEQ